MPPKIGISKLPDSSHSTLAKVIKVSTCSNSPRAMLSVWVVNEAQSCSMRCSGLSVPCRVSSMW